MIRRYVINEFHDHYIETIGTKVSRKDMEVKVEDKEFSLNMQIWDVLGQKAYTAVQSRAFVGMDGALVVADLTRKETLESLESYWLPSLQKVVADAQLVFLGNKSDLGQSAQFSDNDLKEVASRYPTPDPNNYFITSAKTGENVEEAFLCMAKMMLSFQALEDPTKEIFEELLAESVLMERDKSSLIGVTDSIITDFCKEYKDKEEGMKVIREQFVRAGVTISNPTKQGINRAIDYLAEEALKFMNADSVSLMKEKWQRLVRDAREEQ